MARTKFLPYFKREPLYPLQDIIGKVKDSKEKKDNEIEVLTDDIVVGEVLDLESDSSECIDKYVRASSSYGGYSNTVVKKERSDDRTIYFYEFSNVNSKPLYFGKVSLFMEWAKKHDVEISTYTQERMEENKINFVACYQNSKYCCTRESHIDLDKAINPEKFRYQDQYYKDYCGGYSDRYYSDWD